MATYEDLVRFLREEMRMSHVYQPLLIQALAEVGGTATIRQLATALLLQDESQIRYYEDRIRKMPLPVLRRRGVVESSADLVRLLPSKLTYEQRAEIKSICEEKLLEFIRQRGLAAWDYRLRETAPVSGSVRYEVLRRAKGRCALCKTTERPLHVDHIEPRSKHGTNDLDNLQALCDLCNQGKSNRDNTDFRELAALDAID